MIWLGAAVLLYLATRPRAVVSKTKAELAAEAAAAWAAKAAAADLAPTTERTWEQYRR